MLVVCDGLHYRLVSFLLQRRKTLPFSHWIFGCLWFLASIRAGRRVGGENAVNSAVGIYGWQAQRQRRPFSLSVEGDDLLFHATMEPRGVKRWLLWVLHCAHSR